MTVRVGVVLFPGSNRDIDAVNALRVAGAEPAILWHEAADIAGVAGILLPGGFAYGDYLRAGVIARFSPVMRAVADFAARGGPVLGICNGFQVLAEARLVPGALLRNRGLRFVCREVTLLPEHMDTPFTREIGERRPLRMPVAHGEGCYYADEETLDELERDGGVLWRYANADGSVAGPDDPGNPNGSLRGIAGVRNAAGNVAGLMPHPETAVEAILGSDDGLGIIRSLVVSAAEWASTGSITGTRPAAGATAAGHGGPAGRRRRAMTGPATGPLPVPLHRTLGLEDVELEAIREKLGREPNDLELAMFSVMWSEHCSYKSSRPLLGTLPTKGEDVIAGVGEQAGVIAIGDGLAVAFKIESHNHPSAVEPYQGAATGVGGILRDVFAMGARPIAVLDALRFGDPSDARTRHLVDGVVRGVGGYGNCVGVPTVGGELVFDPSYQGNPLVNVMAIGLLEDGMLMRASADGPGNLVVLYGSATGRDGIGGASVLASATFGEQDPSKRPSVQVGDPFAEKLLIEATLEIIAKGLAVSIQDLGAAGITCATCETADRGGTGMLVDLDAIPRREPGLEPFEVMISESQERMVAIVEPGPLGGRARRLRALGPAGGDHRPGDPGAGRRHPHGPRRARRAGCGRAPGGRGPGARADPRPGPRVRGDRLPARVASPVAPPRGPRPRRTGRVRGPPAAPRPGSRRRAAGAARLAQPVVAPPGLRAVRPQRPGQHRRRPRPGRRRDPDQGHDQGARGHDRRQCRGERAGPVAGRRDVRRGGLAQRVHHRRTAAGRHELPQLRRPDAPGGLLGPGRGRPRPRRRVRGPRPAGHRRQRLALQRGAGLLDRAHAGDRHRGAAGGRRRPAWDPRSAPVGTACCSWATRARAWPGASTRAWPGRRPRTARRSWTCHGAAAPGLHPGGHRPRTRRELPGRVRRRPRGGDRGDVHLGRHRRAAPARRGRLAGGGAVRGEPVPPGRRDRPPPRSGARAAGPAARAARGTMGTTGGTRLVVELGGEGATGAAEERGSRVADALEVPVEDLRHAWEHGLPRALGWEADA